jgi:hypothetical protein
MAGKRELLEWLGVRPADFVTYAACAVAGSMYFVYDKTVDVLLAVMAVALALIACAIGMRRDPEVSSLTNTMKLVSYPLCLVIVGILIAANYILWQ